MDLTKNFSPTEGFRVKASSRTANATANGSFTIANVEFKYVCEVNDNRGGEVMRSLQKASGNAPQRLKDFRRALEDKEVHGVVIATPESKLVGGGVTTKTVNSGMRVLTKTVGR